MITVNDIARMVGGDVQGDGDVEILGMVPAGFARSGDLTFALDESQMKVAEKSEASCVLTTVKTTDFPKTILRVNNIKEALTVLYNAMLEMKLPRTGVIHPTAVIDKTAVLGENVSAGPYAVIGKNTKIGDNSIIDANCAIGENVTIGTLTHLYPNVTAYDYSVIGNNVTLHSGTVIGSDGFGYIPKEGRILKVPQLSSVVIEDDVEIGANSCVDRGTFTNTVIGKGTKIDNLVQVAHNVKIGKNVLIAGQAGIAGSSTVGDNTMMGGQSGISDHVNVGKNAKIGAQSGVMKDAEKDGAVLFGCPARDAREQMKQIAFVAWLYKNTVKIRKLLKK